MTREIVLDRLVYKVKQLEKFNMFYQPGDNINFDRSGLVVLVNDEDKENFLHLLKDVNTEVKRIIKCL